MGYNGIRNETKGGREDMTFQEWKKKVDASIEKKCGLDSDGLPDWDYYTAWQEGVTPSSAATQAIRAAREF